MERDEIFALAEQIKKVCPEDCKVEIVPTKQSGNVYLVVLQIPSTETVLTPRSTNKMDWNADKFQAVFKKDPILKTAYNWEVQQVHDFHYEKILPLLGDAEHFRVMYCCGGKFVFYVHTFGCMKERAHVFNYIGMNDREHFKYIGTCRNIDLLIGFLMTTFTGF